MGDAIRKADLPERCVLHGLREAAARRLAEAGCTANAIMAVTGHRTLSEVECCTRAAHQVRLAREVMREQVVASLHPPIREPAGYSRRLRGLKG